MTKEELRDFMTRHTLSAEQFGRFVGLESKLCDRTVIHWLNGTRSVPDSVAQIVRVAELVPSARLALAGELSKRAALASIGM